MLDRTRLVTVIVTTSSNNIVHFGYSGESGYVTLMKAAESLQAIIYNDLSHVMLGH